MEIKNNIRLMIIKRGYKSLRKFSIDHGFNYLSLLKLANNQTMTVDKETLVELCEKLDCNIDDLLYIEREVGENV